MIQKIFLSKNKFLLIIIAIFFSLALIIFFVQQKYSYDYFIKKIETNLGLKINKKGEFSVSIFPTIHFIQNDLEISKTAKNLSFISREMILEIVKEYRNLSKTKFKIYSHSTVINGIHLKNTTTKGILQNSNIKIINFFANINEGKL